MQHSCFLVWDWLNLFLWHHVWSLRVAKRDSSIFRLWLLFQLRKLKLERCSASHYVYAPCSCAYSTTRLLMPLTAAALPETVAFSHHSYIKGSTWYTLHQSAAQKHSRHPIEGQTDKQQIWTSRVPLWRYNYLNSRAQFQWASESSGVYLANISHMLMNRLSWREITANEIRKSMHRSRLTIENQNRVEGKLCKPNFYERYLHFGSDYAPGGAINSKHFNVVDFALLLQKLGWIRANSFGLPSRDSSRVLAYKSSKIIMRICRTFHYLCFGLFRSAFYRAARLYCRLPNAAQPAHRSTHPPSVELSTQTDTRSRTHRPVQQMLPSPSAQLINKFQRRQNKTFFIWFSTEQACRSVCRSVGGSVLIRRRLSACALGIFHKFRC